jgi:hypothetical protein
MGVVGDELGLIDGRAMKRGAPLRCTVGSGAATTICGPRYPYSPTLTVLDLREVKLPCRALQAFPVDEADDRLDSGLGSDDMRRGNVVPMTIDMRRLAMSEPIEARLDSSTLSRRSPSEMTDVRLTVARSGEIPMGRAIGNDPG